MKTIIFYANPNTNGHCGAILSEIKTQLNKKNASYLVINLDREKYDPVMYPEEHYTNKGYKLSKQTKKYQDLIAKNDHFIFIHPVWWNTMPAILKGFFDKVFVGRFAFQYKKFPIIPFAIPLKLLKGKKAAVFSTTGAQNWMAWLFLGYRYRKIVTKDILGFCGIKAKGFSLHNCTGSCEKHKHNIPKLVRRGLKWLH